ncbi:MAG: DUF309 domain-containing protein [Candidatus Aenigmarchaeota archaeon]|nr:DUF309 domain-containing protein [Candidatus Aenigmarchaeota archaeon]
MKVYCEIGGNPPTSADERIGTMIKAAGGIPFPQGRVDVSKLEKFAPDLMIASWSSFGLKIDRAAVYNRAGWQGVKAINEKRLFILHDAFLRRSEAARLIRMIVNPSSFVNEDVASDTILKEGIALFNQRRFFECHEFLENVWAIQPGKIKTLYQAIIQTAGALYHREKGNDYGFKLLLGKAKENLKKCGGMPVNTGELLDALENGKYNSMPSLRII